MFGRAGKPKEKRSELELAQDVLIREVDEDLRQDELKALWSKYGGAVIAACVGLVLAVAGYQGWKAWDASVRAEASDRFSTAVAELPADPADAEATFGSLASDAPGGYAFLSGLREGEALVRLGDPVGAAAVYERLAAETEDPMLRDLALIRSALTRMAIGSDSVDAEALGAQLTPLADDGRPMRFTARELIAYLALREGDTERARQLFEALAADEDTPPGLKLRARSMAAAISG